MLPNKHCSFSDEEEEDGEDAEMDTEEKGEGDGTAEKVHGHTAQRRIKMTSLNM